jgi:hypothetical protein
MGLDVRRVCRFGLVANHLLLRRSLSICVRFANIFTEYADPETDGGLEQDLASRRYRALLPEEEYDSDDF